MKFTHLTSRLALLASIRPLALLMTFGLTSACATSHQPVPHGELVSALAAEASTGLLAVELQAGAKMLLGSTVTATMVVKNLDTRDEETLDLGGLSKSSDTLFFRLPAGTYRITAVQLVVPGGFKGGMSYRAGTMTLRDTGSLEPFKVNAGLATSLGKLEITLEQRVVDGDTIASGAKVRVTKPAAQQTAAAI